MNIQPSQQTSLADIAQASNLPKAPEKDATKEAFDKFVGETMFGSMLASMRKSVGKSAYMHGGRGEEIFQKQLDQKFVEELTEASAAKISGPMYDLFQLQRRA